MKKKIIKIYDYYKKFFNSPLRIKYQIEKIKTMSQPKMVEKYWTRSIIPDIER